MRIYLSGKIDGENFYEYKFGVVADILKSKGYDVVNPVELGKELKSCIEFPKRKDYLLADLTALANCDAIYMLRGWECSEGAFIEWIFAKTNKLKIYYECNL